MPFDNTLGRRVPGTAGGPNFEAAAQSFRDRIASFAVVPSAAAVVTVAELVPNAVITFHPGGQTVGSIRQLALLARSHNGAQVGGEHEDMDRLGRAIVMPQAAFETLWTDRAADLDLIASDTGHSRWDVLRRARDLGLVPPVAEASELERALETIDSLRASAVTRSTNQRRASLGGGTEYHAATRANGGTIVGHGLTEDAATIDLARRLIGGRS